jgi:hypothetical protein
MHVHICLSEDFPNLAANEGSGSSSRLDAIKFAGNNQSLRGGMQEVEMDIRHIYKDSALTDLLAGKA